MEEGRKTMTYTKKMFQRICEIGNVIGGSVLVFVMILIVVNVITRLFSRVVPGVYEITELLIVVTAGFSLVYTTFLQGHIEIKILIEKLSLSVQLALRFLAYALSAIIWGTIAWVNINFMFERWIMEQTPLLNIPYLPFRFIWAISLTLIAILFLINSLENFLKISGGDK